MRVFWYIVPCSLVGVDRRFRGAYCPHRQGDDPPHAPQLELEKSHKQFVNSTENIEHKLLANQTVNTFQNIKMVLADRANTKRRLVFVGYFK
jgi:hypothetical protein